MKKLFLLVICFFCSDSFVYSKLDINLEISFTYFAYFIPVHQWIAELKNVVPNTVQSVEDHNCTFSFLYEPEKTANGRGMLHLTVTSNERSDQFFVCGNKVEAIIPFVSNCVKYSDDFMDVICSVSDSR